MNCTNFKSFEEYRADLCAKALTLLEARSYKCKISFFIDILGYNADEAAEAIKECRACFNRLISDGWPTADIIAVGRS